MPKCIQYDWTDTLDAMGHTYQVRCSEERDIMLCHRGAQTIMFPCMSGPDVELLCNISYELGVQAGGVFTWRVKIVHTTDARGPWRCSA